MENTFQPLGVGVGTLINNRYELVRKLGSGAMSAVYLVADRELKNDTIALKLFAPGINSDPKLVERIHNEVLITRKLNSPHIVRTYDFGQTREGLFYMTMEYIEGTTLHRLAHSAEHMAFVDIVRILRDVAYGISHAHAHGVIHRDLKPANVIVSENGDVKIADFGLARALNVSHDLTQVGECVGTPYYMSPEQIQGLELDCRSDIYSLGIIAYELVTGDPPFHEQSWYNLAHQIIQSPLPEFPRDVRTPKWFFEFVGRAAAKKPDDRFTDATDVAEFLNSKLESPELLSSSGTEAKLPKVLSRVALSTTKPEADSAGLSIRVNPTAVLIIAAAVFAFAVLVVLTRPSAPASIQQSAQNLNGMADTMNKMTRFVTFMVENQEKIEKLSKQMENEPSEVPQQAEPAESPPGGYNAGEAR